MPLLISGAAAVVSAMNRAFTNTSPSNAVYANQIVEAGTTAASQAAWAVSFGSKFTGTSAALADLLLTNTGIKTAGGEALATAVAAIIDIVGVANVGQVAMLLSNALSTLEGDATYGTAAAAWNGEVTAAYEYSANTANTTASSASAVTGNEAASSYVLLPTPEVKNGTAGNDFFRGVAGVQIGGQDQTTLNSSDVLDGLAGADTLIVNMTGDLYSGGARIKNIETLQIGTNLTTGATFDYNVNAGFNEISEVTKVVADQINVGETLTVQNVVRTINADASKTMPTLAWVNDDNSRDAGIVAYNYRAAELTGTTDNQQVELTSVTNGEMNLSAGMETISITSKGTQRVTLNDSTLYAAEADVMSTGLTTVNLAGSAEIGKAAGILTNGLTDRVFNTFATAASGNLVAATQTDGTGVATQSNLLSVGASVTKIDAAAATAAVNVRFTNTASSNNTFIGGAGNDYSEYELGNINASGGAGDDTFAFVTRATTAPSSALGESDTIVGGDGADTILIGLNGVGTYNISESELRNKSSIGTLDLRGAVNNLSLSSDFVSKADTADTINVFTNKIVQTSASDAGNTVTQLFALEDATVNTINITQTSANQTVNFVGGSGSDRIIASDATFNVLKNLDGGNYTSGTGGSAEVVGDYDTITVVTNGERVVLDSNDFTNVKDFEGLVLTKNSAQAIYDITLTSAFLNANTEAVNNFTNTSIDDRFFQIGTVNAVNNNALGVGDVVNIDITGIAAVTTRFVDLNSLIASGATVNLINAGVVTAYAANGARLGPVAPAVITTLLGGDAAGVTDVIGGSPAIPAAPVQIVFNGTSGNTTSGFEILDSKVATSGNDTIVVNGLGLLAGAVINGSAGVDTLQLNGTTSLLAGPTIAGIENTVIAGGTTLLSAAQYVTLGAVTGSTVADSVTIAAAVASAITTSASVETYNLTGAVNWTVTGVSAGVAGQTFNMGPDLNATDVVTGGAATTDVVTSNTYTAADDFNGVTAVETIRLLAGHTTGITFGGAFAADTTRATVDATALTVGEAYNFAGVTNRGLTLNLNVANAAVDTITASVLVSNVANAHAVSGLGALDVLVMGVNATVVDTVTIAAFNSVTFAGDVNAALAQQVGYLASATGAVIVNIAGTTDKYVVAGNLTAGGFLVDGTDTVIKVVGANTLLLDGTSLA